ncbi:MAG TPA: hypothetical protein VHZ95_13635, partial [Polyangiales bacterium]|nr:hypothetical protein [Polyangiales bacterium]
MRTSSGSAERLQRAAGSWKLEFQQLVYNTPSLLRPRRFAVQGEQAILQQLREFTGHEPLARDAERLFARGALPDGTYVVRDGRWFPELQPNAVADPVASGLGVDENGKSPLSELTQRIASLESTVRTLQQSLDQALKALATAATQRMAVASERSDGDAASSLPPSAASRSPALAGPEDDIAPAASAATESNAKIITLPTLSGLSDLIKSLAGPEAVIAPTERIDWKQVSTQM